MFDILLYLYDNYLVADLHPDAETLSRKLAAVGFEADDIDRALDWLNALDTLDADAPAGEGQRCFTDEERRRLDPEGVGFLTHLETAGLLTPQAREWVIEQALALEDEDDEVSADKIKWITLLAISRLSGPGDALWLEDLVRAGEDGWQPTLH